MEHKLIKEGDYLFTEDRKAHLPLNGASMLNDLDVLPEIDDEVEKLAIKYNPVMNLDNEFIRKAFKAGYEKAKETYNYTKEDIIDAVMLGVCFEDPGVKDISTYEELKELAIKRVNQPKLPKYFIQQTGLTHCDRCPTGFEEYGLTKELPEGRVQWIGEYQF